MEPAIVAWPNRAACLGMDPALFFPERGDHAGLRQAKAVCAECEVRTECLDEGMRLAEYPGVRGGLSARERKRLLHERLKAA